MNRDEEDAMSAIWWIVIIAILGVAILYYVNHRRTAASNSLHDSAADARRVLERLGGQVYSLDPKDDPAARQALADAAERFTAAGAQVEQAQSEHQYRLAEQTAIEGLYYISAARTALGLDPGPPLPSTPGQTAAGAIAADRSVTVDGRRYAASANPSEDTQYYYPGGLVAGRPVPRGWYSEPWWGSARDSGAWSLGTYLVASTLLVGVPVDSWGQGYETGYAAAAGAPGDDGHAVDYSSGDVGGDIGDL